MTPPNTHSYPVSVSSLHEFFSRHPIDTNKHSRQIITDLGDLFKRPIRINTLVLAALWAGYAIYPSESGRVFRFYKLDQ